MKDFKQLLHSSFKSNETEEWLDIHFTRPVGLVFALLWQRLGVSPNAVTLLSVVLGAAAGYMFYFTDLAHNLAGVALLVLANLCDSTDGQLARLTHQTSALGRALDGFSSELWFFCIYLALALRLDGQFMPYTDVEWGIWIWALAAVSGLIGHSSQSSLSDYYRQIHLYFLQGNKELDSYRSQLAVYEQTPRKAVVLRLYHYFYAHYCKRQEARTPAFQQFFALWQQAVAGPQGATGTAAVREQFLRGSRRLIPYTNILTFNVRALVLYLTCLGNFPWVYFFFEITVLHALYIYMHKQHEALCRRMSEQLTEQLKQ